MRKATIALLALVLTILAAAATQAVTVPELTQCTPYFAGLGQSCRSGHCLGDAFCAENICFPKQVIIGKACAHHYECYRGLEMTDSDTYVAYCDTSSMDKEEHVCKFTKDIDESCTSHIECQSNRCINGICSLVTNGTACETTANCRPFDGELSRCDSVEKVCVAKKANGQPCSSADHCISDWCYNEVCRPKDYKKEGDSCDPILGACAPAHDRSDNYLQCLNDKCVYPARLRERFFEIGCVNDYAEYNVGNEWGTCDKKACYHNGHFNCNSNEFCDCTNNVCMNKQYGNMVHECDFENGFRSQSSNAFTRCMKSQCPNTLLSSNAIILDKKSCAYTNCRQQYMDVVKCKRSAAREYGATSVYFFGAGTGAASLAKLSPIVAAMLVIVNVAYLLF